MAWTYLITATLCLGWMLSPDVFIRVGNGVGANKTLFIVGGAVAALLAARALFLVRHPQLQNDGGTNRTDLLVYGVGPTLTTTLLLASRMALVLLIPTGALVASGYAFNEIFVYWFPNFGFAYLLLALVVVLHLVSEAFARKAQIVFTALVLSSMLILSVAGWITTNSSPVPVDTGASFSLPLLAGSLFFFLGLEFSPDNLQTESRFPAIGALLVGLVLFFGWAMLSIHSVPAERLSGTTIPHLIAARAIWGDTGRVLMGITIIAGTCGVVNALFHLAIGSFRELAARGLLPGHPRGELMPRRYVVLFALIIGVLMGKGLAGYEILDTYIQASLLLWLFVGGMQAFSAATLLGRRGVPHSWHGHAIMTVYTVAVVSLIASDSEAVPIVRFLALILLPTAALAAFWSRRRLALNVTNNQHAKGGHS